MAELDDKLRALLTDRKATLEDLAKKDLEAAELLGTTLSGYATLRRFYELRDEYGKSTGPGGSSLPPRLALLKRRRVAVPLIAVLVASCDSIRGGLYDSTRDTTVSPDFVLALLGEASVFLSSSSSLSDDRSPSTDDPTAIVTSGPGALTLAHVDALLKAVEDAATITGRVRAAAEDFFSVVLAAAPGGLKGSTPTDLLRRTTSTRSSGSTTTGTGSFMLTGSSMLASQLQRSMSGPSSGASVARGWDWRSGLVASQASSADVLRRLRVGLARELARLWIAQADDVLV